MTSQILPGGETVNGDVMMEAYFLAPNCSFVPEPCSAALLAAGGVGLVRGKRRGRGEA